MAVDAAAAAQRAAMQAAASRDREAVQTARAKLPFLYAMMENFVREAGAHVRGGNVLGYSETCLRAAISEALTTYALQVYKEQAQDAAALVRSMTVMQDSRAAEA
jgi:hypothetical protein